MINFQQDAKRDAKDANASILSSLYNELDKVQKANNGVVPHGIIINLILSVNTTSPTVEISYHNIRYLMKKWTRERAIETKCPSSY